MIFVTVGTHEQSFDRLLKYIDDMIDEKIIKEEVICQKGFTDYKPKNYKAEKLFSYDKMQKYISDARIVITHGGPASFLDPLKYGKIPIVVPRKKEFNEHVNNHQVDFSMEVEKKLKNILICDTEEQLKENILNYDNKIKNMNNNICSNNEIFCKKLIKEIESIF